MLNWRELHLTTLNPCSSDEDLWSLEWSQQRCCWRCSGDLFWWAPWSHTRKDRSETQSDASPSLWPLIITFKAIWWLFVFYCYVLSTIIFCNWMHVLLFFQLIQSKRDWVGYLGAPAHWNCKWHSTVSSHGPGWAEVASRGLLLCEGHRCLQAGGTCSNFVCCQTEAAPVPHPPLTESFENIKSFWCVGVMERAELLQDAEVNRKGPAWAPGRANFCLHTEHLKEASAFLQTLGDCQCVVAWADEGRVLAFDISLSEFWLPSKYVF